MINFLIRKENLAEHIFKDISQEILSETKEAMNLRI